MTEPQELDNAEIDDAVLASLALGIHGTNDLPRAWKSHDWDTLSRLHDAGFIYDPVGKAKSVAFTPDGLKRSQELLHSVFGKNST